MAEHTLFAEPRTVTGKQVQQLRNQGFVPAVLFGRDMESISIQCEESSLARLLKEAGMTALISLQIGDQGEIWNALVRDIQIHPVRRTIQHVDFYRVVMTETLTTELGISLVGEASLTGTLIQDLTSVQIECLPGDLIPVIEYDVSNLTDDDTVTIKDLRVPGTITILADEDDVVAHVEALRRLEVEEEALEEEMPEVGLVSRVDEEAEF